MPARKSSGVESARRNLILIKTLLATSNEFPGAPIVMASRAETQPEEAHLYRYRTAALVGPWRKSARQAVLDAVRAHLVRREGRDRQTLRWLVPGRIEEMAAD